MSLILPEQVNSLGKRKLVLLKFLNKYFENVCICKIISEIKSKIKVISEITGTFIAS